MSADSARPTEAAPATTGQDRSTWRYLKDMEEPPELAEAIDRACREHRYRKPAERLRVAEEVKLHYFFGGQDVGFMRTPQGRVVVVVGAMNTEPFNAALACLTPEERGRVILYSPQAWDDTSSTI